MKILRRVSQLFFLYIFIFTSAKHFFYFDPIILFSNLLCTYKLWLPLLCSIMTIIIIFLFGRVFCGWICPMGTVLDMIDKLIKLVPLRKSLNIKNIKFYLLFFIFFSALFSLQLTFLFDPLSILKRSTVTLTYPLFHIQSSFYFDYRLIYYIFKSCCDYYQANLAIVIIFLIIIMLEVLRNRFWCYNICPLGALYSFISKRMVLYREVNHQCSSCNKCATVCKMSSEVNECIVCFRCQNACKNNAIRFKIKIKKIKIEKKPEEILLLRRYILTSLISAIFVVPLIRTLKIKTSQAARLIRPPGSSKEEEFLKSCIRCSACTKVCPTGVIQPMLIDINRGAEVLWTPHLTYRISHCDYDCILCGKVCPTGAIKKLTIEQKHNWRLGLAYIDKMRCFAWKYNIGCLVCEEHCPVPNKAIGLKIENSIKKPFVIIERCIGCGLCEEKCPAEPTAIFIRELSI